MKTWNSHATALRGTEALGVAALGVFLVLAIVGPWLAPYSPLAIDLAHEFELPSARHWLGTTDNGVDILSILLCGARLSGVVAIGTVSASLLIGAALGTFAGYRGGRIDHVVTGLCDLVQAFPSIVLNVSVLALTAQPGLLHLLLALIVHGWVLFARVARANALVLRNAEFVLAARALGVSEFGVLARHVVPNLAGPLVVLSTAALGSAVLAESTLSFLGLGPGAAASWGALLDQGSAVLLRFPHVALIAGGTIAVNVYAANRAGDFLRDRLDPRRC
jgi:ABC-type dipeptide/oligopeptide/nickel transport system permease subunit